MASCPKKYIMHAVEDPEEQDRLNHLHDSIGQQALETKNYRREGDNIQAITSRYVDAMKFLTEMREKYAPGVAKLARQGNKIFLEVDVTPLIPKQLELPLKLSDPVNATLLFHYSRSGTNPISSFIEGHPLYTTKSRNSYKEYGKEYQYTINPEAVIKNLTDFHGKYGIDLDAHDVASKGLHPYNITSDELAAIKKEGVDILIDNWGEYIILNPKSVKSETSPSIVDKILSLPTKEIHDYLKNCE